MFKNYKSVLWKIAQNAIKKDEVPVACIAVFNGVVIAKAHNLTESKKDKTLHAEMIVIKKLQKKFGTSNFLNLDLSLYITLEPCCMCLAAISLCGIRNVYYMVEDEKFSGQKRIFTEKSAYYMPNLYHICDESFAEILKDFFKNKR